MTITYPLDFPTTIGLTDSVLKARTSVARSQSPFSFAEQIYTWSGERWELELVLPVMTRAQVEEFYSFMTKLRGRHGTFTCFVPSATTSRGAYQQTGTDLLTTEGGDNITTEGGDNITIEYGNIVVNGSSQTGRKLIIDGFSPNMANVLKEGDYFQLGTGSNTRLYKILNDVNSNASGATTLDIFPALRSSPADNEALILENPKGLFRLAMNEFDMPSDHRNIFSLSLSAIEAIDGT